MKSKEWKFKDFPVKMELSFYFDIEKKIIEYFLQKRFQEELVGIFRVGRSYQPGISDMDFLVILEDRLFTTSGRDYYIKQIIPQRNVREYLFLHEFYIYPKSLAIYFYYLHPQATVEKIFGKDLDFFSLKEELREVAFYTIIDTMVSYIWRPFLKMWLEKCIYVRQALLKISSLGYTFSLFKKFSGENYEAWDEFSLEVEKLREEWFDIGDKERKYRIETSFWKGMEYCWEVIHRVDRLLFRRIPQIQEENLFAFFWGKNNLTVFLPTLDKEKSLQYSAEIFKEFGELVIFLPWSFSLSLFGLSTGEGRFSEYINKRFVREKRLDYKWEKAFVLRKNLLNKLAEFCYYNKVLFTPLVSYGYTQSIDWKSFVYNIFSELRVFRKSRKLIPKFSYLLMEKE